MGTSLRDSRNSTAAALERARREHDEARRAADAAYERLQASSETLEYKIDWDTARRHEAATAHRLLEAERACRRAEE